MNIPLNNPVPVKRRSQAGFENRVRSFLTDIKSMLADGNFHHIDSQELCLLHGVGNDMLMTLKRMNCVERRRPRNLKASGHYFEYRRTPNLAQLTAETYVKQLRTYRQEYWQKYKTKKAAEVESIVDAMTPPAPVEPMPEPVPAAPPADEPPAKKIPEHYILLLNQKVVDDVFYSEEAYLKHINDNAKQDQEWIVCSIVATFKTKVSIDKII